MRLLIVVVFVALLPAHSALVDAAMGRKPTWEQRFERLNLPMVSGVKLSNDWPWPSDGQEISAGAVSADNTIHWRGQRPSQVTVGHEMFHLLDAAALRPSNQRRLTRLMGLKPGAWQVGYGLHGGTESPNEVAADWYGNLVAGKGRGKWDGAYSGPPELRQLVRFGEFLERVGRKRGLDTYRSPLGG